MTVVECNAFLIYRIRAKRYEKKIKKRKRMTTNGSEGIHSYSDLYAINLIAAEVVEANVYYFYYSST